MRLGRSPTNRVWTFLTLIPFPPIPRPTAPLYFPWLKSFGKVGNRADWGAHNQYGWKEYVSPCPWNLSQVENAMTSLAGSAGCWTVGFFWLSRLLGFINWLSKGCHASYVHQPFYSLATEAGQSYRWTFSWMERESAPNTFSTFRNPNACGPIIFQTAPHCNSTTVPVWW